jgi:cysteine-rich repeat protein
LSTIEQRSSAQWVVAASFFVMMGATACAAGEINDPFGSDLTLGQVNSTSGGTGESDDDSVASEGEGGSTTGAPSTSASTNDTTPGETEATSAHETGDTDGDVPPACGDGVVDAGEECDDGPANADDAACKSDCTLQACGDGHVGPGEACDDGAANAWEAGCLPDCTIATCGDGHVHAGVEACDDGTNDGAYGGCMPGCGALAPHCGDGVLQAQHEHCDTALAQPFPEVPCSNACLYDFSTVPQLYCNGTCAWAGAQNCDQADADIYCRLRTGNPASTASSFQVVTALAQHGFSCPGYATNLGPLPQFGVNQDVWYQSTSVLANHGSGQVVASATCTNP